MNNKTKLGLSISALVFTIIIWPIIMLYACYYKTIYDAEREKNIVGSVIGGAFSWLSCMFFAALTTIAMIITFSILIHKYRKTI